MVGWLMGGSASDLERDLREAAATGEPLDLGDRPKQEVPAEVLYSVLAGDSAPAPRAVKLLRARITGPLDFEASLLRCPLRLDRCRFSDDITFDEATAPAIRLIRCRMTSLSADQLETRGNLELSGSTATGEVRMRGAHIGGELRFDGATLTNPVGWALDADGLRVEQGAFFREAFSAAGGVHLPRAYVGGLLNFDGAKLSGSRGALRGDLLRVEQGMFCRRGFSTEGELRLPRAHIGGQLSFRDASLHNPGGQALYAHGLRVDQSMRCDEKFVAEGELVLLGAQIGGQLIFTGATLHKPGGQALIAERLRVDLNVFCNDGFIADGNVVMRGVQVGGELSFAGATLGTDSHLLDLEGVEARILDLRFAAMPAGAVRLRDARVGRLRDKPYPDEGRWPRCQLDGCRYEVLDAESDVSVKERLEWVARDPDAYAPQPYEQLAAVYTAHGDDSAARQVAIEKQRRRRQQPQLPLPAKVWSWFLGATVGHGYRLWFAGAWLLVLVGVGSLLFSQFFEAGMRASDDLTPARSADQIASFQPIIYTVDALVPVLNLGQETAWNAHGAAQWTSASLTVVGWLLTTALLAGIVARRQ
jgi:hypothetical protein